MTAQRPPRVFISYSHDSEEHAARVLRLARDLRRDGIEAILDQYITSPPEGWQRWMDGHIRDADFVIMVCTDTYYRRVIGMRSLARMTKRCGCGIWKRGSVWRRLLGCGDHLRCGCPR